MPTTFNLSVAETLTAKEMLAGATNGRWQDRVRESLTAADTPSGYVIHKVRVTEALDVHAHPNGSTDGTYFFFKREFLNAKDTASLDRGGGSNAVMSATDHVSARIITAGNAGTYNLTVDETLSVTDTDVDPETFTSVGINFWGYGWALDAGITTLAVYVAGLDVGDWPVLAQGQVFVPWQADADGLFTPGYLVNLSNALSADVPNNYGATACNIDLHNNNGDITRVTVDLAIGVPYKSRMQLVRPNTPDMTHSQYGPSLAETRRIHQYGLQLVSSQGISVGTTDDNLRPVQFTNARGDKYAGNRLFSGIFWSQADADYDFDNMMMVEVERPWPATIAALIGFLKTFDRE